MENDSSIEINNSDTNKHDSTRDFSSGSLEHSDIIDESQTEIESKRAVDK